MKCRGQGPTPCEFLLIGEGPGFEEDRIGYPFAPRGKTGKEVRRYFNGSDLPAFEDVYRTNIFRDYRGKDYKYTDEDLERDEPTLLKELKAVRPKIIIPLGRYAVRYFMGDVDMDAVWGIPWYLPKQDKFDFIRKAVVFPIHHPAAAFHNPEMSPYVVEGFKSLSDFLDDKLQPRGLYDDPYPSPHYEEITTSNRLTQLTQHWTARTRVSIDTEGWPGNPWSLQFSDKPGVGYLIRKTNPRLLSLFIAVCRQHKPRLVFHSALHDLGMGRSLNADFQGLDFDDTMVMAYLLQIEPQGLKPGCLRHCNMKMSDYTDVLGDAGDRIAIEYLTWLWDALNDERNEKSHAEFIRATTTPYQDKRGNWKSGRRLKSVKLLPKTKLHAAVERCLSSKRPRGLWEDQIEDIEVAAYRLLGPMPEATLDYVEPRISIPYGCRDADGTGRYEKELSQRIDAKGLREVYNLEISTYPLIDRMAKIGVKPDLDHFAALSTKLQGEIDRLQQELETATERPLFNANSGDQVADYVFGQLGLEEMKLTRSGRGSTNDKILEALEHEHPEHPALSTIREYREVYKLKNTFVDRLPDFVHRWPHDGRIHATFRTTRVVTGRLAASDPNLLAQPEHGKFAKDFKRGWVCDDGHILYQADESQVELRGLAHLSQDPVMLATFRGERRNPDGSLVDLHAALAERIFGVKPKDQDKSKHRLPAKAINFGIPMGMTCKGLSVELRKNGVEADEDTAQRWLDETLGLYRGVRVYMEQRIAEARRYGFVRCLSGRIRYIGGIRSSDERVREEAERFAFSTPIQESAQFVMKQAEATVYNDILIPYWKQGRWVEPILQIHDCLKLEAEEKLAQDLNRKIVAAMTNVPKGFSVPLAVESEWGYNMADMEKF